MARTLLALGVGLALMACQADPQAPALEQRQDKMVNGEPEYGWPGVGALVLDTGWGLQSFCTGTLIDPEWVLTAAHCIEGVREMGLPPTPEYISFFEGHDANTGDGYTIALERIYVHPDYEQGGFASLYDMALLKLRSPSDLTAYPIQREPFSSNIRGNRIFATGYGVNDGNRETGGGVKRSGYFTVEDLLETFVIIGGDNVGVCYGDSGGPIFMEVGGEWTVIGVNSTTAGNGVTDPCLGTSAQTRTDAYITWIDEIMGTGDGQCSVDECACEAACSRRDFCDNTLCEAERSCESIIGCMNRCGNEGGCALECYEQGTLDAREAFDGFATCAQSCADDRDYSGCLDRRCYDEQQACFAVAGTDTCEQILECRDECITEACADLCVTRGTAEGSAQFEAWQSCAERACRDFVGDDAAFARCSAANCRDEMLECRPADDCRVTGGDCGGEACMPSAWRASYCESTAGVAPGGDCNGTIASAQCTDGYICVGAPWGICTPMCQSDNDCEGGGACDMDAVAISVDVGACTASCPDEDGDGLCGADDCDDTNPQAGQTEVCDDGVDNDCDGQVDEDCGAPCVDGDGDGACQPNDCNDADPNSHPGAQEICGDGMDNNCDGVAEEGCGAPCVDGDADGVCQPNDCNDADPNIAPGRPEVCGDWLDNNCDGQIDDGCGGGGSDAGVGGDDDDDEISGFCSFGLSHGGASPLALAFIALLGLRRRR